jgi:hypothetical protein
VTSGGTWQTFDAAGNPAGRGTDMVTGLVEFHLAQDFGRRP